METQFDIWSAQNELVKSEYSKKNYFVEFGNPKSERCLIACSSNGLYYPNTLEQFTKTILNENRFEWKSICSSANIRKYFGKIIYIRDIYKQWYVTGINHNICDIDHLVEFLQEETKNYSITIVGNSAGGYIATLLGVKLFADCVYNFSGQFSIENGVSDNKFLERYYHDIQKRRYYNIVEEIKNSQIPILYFFPGNVKEDKEQSQLVKGVDTVYPFEFDESVHGKTVCSINYSYIFTTSVDKMKTLSSHYRNKKIKPTEFLYTTAGFYSGTKEIMKKVLKI